MNRIIYKKSLDWLINLCVFGVSYASGIQTVEVPKSLSIAGGDKLKVLLTVKLSCLMRNVDEKPIFCMVVEKYVGERSPSVLKGFVFLGLIETKIKTKKWEELSLSY